MSGLWKRSDSKQDGNKDDSGGTQKNDALFWVFYYTGHDTGERMGKYKDGNVPVAEAARRLGMSRETLCQCMIQNKFPVQIGFAIKKPGNKNYTYYINEWALQKLEREWGFTD